MVKCCNCWRRNGSINFSEQTIFSFTHIEGITLGACEEVSGGSSNIGVDRISEDCDRAG